MRYTFCLTILLFQALTLNAFKGKYPIQNFTPKEYKAGIQNIDFAQNRDMTLFVANNLGVLSFDGNTWKTHSFKTGKKKRSLAFDENNNRLYMGSQGEFGYFDENWNYTSLVDRIPDGQRDFDEVWDVYLANSMVYFCTFQGIYAYDGTDVSMITHELGLNRSFKTNGKLFTQTTNGALLEVKGMQLVKSLPQNQSGEIISGIIPDEEGYLIFYNSGKIEFTTSFGVQERHPVLSANLHGTYVNNVIQLSDDRLAISTQTAGLFLYDLQTTEVEVINTEGGLQTNACLRAFQDYTGILWVGLQNGMAVIDINSPMRLINQEANIQGSGYEAYETSDGTYYTTSNGIYFLAKGGNQSIFLTGTEGPAYGMHKINNQLYAGHHTGLFILEQGSARKLAETDGLWQVKQLQSNPYYAVGGTYSGLFLFEIGPQQVLQPIKKINGFSESSRFFEEDQKGRIWVGQFYKGLYQLTLSEDLKSTDVRNVSDEYDLPIKERIILSRIDNQLHIGTVAGIYKLDQNNDSIVKAELFEDVIGHQEIYLLAQGSKNNIHVYTENLVGFFKQISTQNYVFVPSSLFQMRNTFNNDLLNVSVNVASGIMYNANEGFIQYDPELEDPVEMKQPLQVREVFSAAEDSTLFRRNPFDNKPQSENSLVISQKAKVIQFVVESFQFNEVNNQQFRYYLKGFDEGYGEWGSSTSKEYSNLREGEYEFQVQTMNYLGEVVTSQPFLLNVKPPFYRSTLARIVYALLAVLLIYAITRFQKIKYKRKAQAIEEAKQQELALKQQELVHLKEEKMKSELDHVNSLLAASTMNLVVKNEFMETVKEELKQVRQSGAIRKTNKVLEHLVKEIDTTLRVQEDWHQFEHHFNQVHGDFLNRIREQYTDLSPSEQKLCAFLRLNLNTKEIANLMGISSRGVEVARYRLRKKLDLTTGQNLSKFVLEY